MFYKQSLSCFCLFILNEQRDKLEEKKMFNEQMGFIKDEVLLPATFNDTKIAPTCKK